MSIHIESEEPIKRKFSLVEKIKAYIDLTRAHFAIVWPILFCSGLMLAFKQYNDFSWTLLIKVAFIGLFGFEAGMVLNDILDRNIDHIEPDKKMTKYWRPFNERPIPSGKVSLTEAVVVFCVFLAVAIGLIASLPYPNFLYVFGIMIYAYLVESFYNIKKRNQKAPFAQLIGRTDLTVFPIAGYLCFGQITDFPIFIYLLLLYPWALAHLGANDIADYENDKAKDMKTITVLYGIKGNVVWIAVSTLVHLAIIPAAYFILNLGYVALGCFCLAAVILIIANILLIKKQTPEMGLKILPMFHASLFLYTTSIIIDSALVISL
ncbi:MAG: prenyltransferase [Asgard group archaeon]|nr:prenyltransferase [Asgard group archaeon]